jgi:predicted ATP-grasp superfamily ATP-dependent carboligase
MSEAGPDRIIILGSGITALAVARCAHRLGLAPTIFDTSAQVATRSRLVQAEIHPEPWCDSILARLVQLGERRRSFLVATADAWLQFLILHRTQLEGAYAHILHPGNEALAVCLDKGRFADWCETHGLPTPRRFQLDENLGSDDPRLQFPLLLRPAETLHSAPDLAALKAVEVRTPAELAEQLQRLTRANRQPVLSQSLLGRPLIQHSVGFARHDDRMLVVTARKLRPLPTACAPGTLVETTEDPRLQALAHQVARLLDYQGIGEIEILEDSSTGELFLIEVNPRPWLQFTLGAATGRDLLGLVTRGQAHCRARVTRGRARWLDFRGDLRGCLPALRKRKLGIVAYLRSISFANEYALWNGFDQAPFWRDLVELLSRPLRPAASGPGTTRGAGSAAQRRLRSWRPPGADSKNWSG